MTNNQTLDGVSISVRDTDVYGVTEKGSFYFEIDPDTYILDIALAGFLPDS